MCAQQRLPHLRSKSLCPTPIKNWTAGKPASLVPDEASKGKWWEIFGDADLNALEEQIDVNNQNIAQAEANYRGARAAVRIARSGLFPTLTTSPTVTGAQASGNTGGGSGTSRSAGSLIQFPFDASWEADIWGKVRKGIEAQHRKPRKHPRAIWKMCASACKPEARSRHAFQLHGEDSVKQLLDTTVLAYTKALDLTNNRYNQGVASQIDVVQARTQLEQTRAQATDTMVLRNQLEHAIATIIGKPPSALSIPMKVIKTPPPAVPVGIPSQLLERRPDIAGNERRVAAANANVGVAQAAFYPDLTISASAGISGSSLANLFTWPSRFWSLGPTLSYTLLDFGKRQGTLEQTQAAYDAAVAVYRQSVLQAFQDVEDNLSALRVLEQEAREQAAAVTAAERSLELANNQYQGGITAYLQVITAQAIALSNEQAAVQLLTKRQTACASP